jgi:uncharacterized protein YqkB
MECGRFFYWKGSGIMTNLTINLHVYPDTEMESHILDKTGTPVIDIDTVTIFLQDKETIDKLINELTKLRERVNK